SLAGCHHTKIAMANSITVMKRTTASRHRARLHSGQPKCQQVRITGVITSTPPVSPIHQVHHLSNAPLQPRTPPTYKLVTPHVLPTRHMASAMPTNASVSLTRSKG